MPNNNSEDETDIESNGSWDETDDETEIDEETYEPEELSLTKYNLVLCERYNIFTHGFSDEAKNHYLTHMRLKNINLNYINNINMIYPRLRLEIAECLYLPSQHCVCILKTHWLKLIQRRWKKIHRVRKLIIAMRSHPNALKYREIYGKWPNNCSNYPVLKGMLSRLSSTSS